MRHQVFTSSSGSRRLHGIPQILILLSSRSSSDEIIGPAMALEDLEIVIVSIVVKNADLNELKTVSIQSQFTHYIDQFDDLPSVEPQIVSTLKNIPKESRIPKTEVLDSAGKSFHYKQ